MRITVHAGHHDRVYCPVRVTLPGLDPAAGPYCLLVEKTRERVPACALPAPGGAELVFILRSLPRGESAAFILSRDASCAGSAGGCGLSDDGQQVRVLIDGRFFTQYYYGPATVKPYLGPIYGPQGAQITRLNFEEKEHVHHRSLWFSHGSVNGVDTWNEPAGRHGRIINHGIEKAVTSGACASFTARNTWTDFDKNPLLEDKTTLTFYNTPGELSIFDAELTLTAAYGDVTLGSTKEAGPIAVRVNYALTAKNGGTLVNAYGGINEGEVWMKRAPWCDYSGVEEGRRVGIAILDAPENPRHPAWWHARDYGLMAPNNYHLGGDELIPAGESRTYRYRVIAHGGGAQEADIAGRFQDYANGPTVTVVE